MGNKGAKAERQESGGVSTPPPETPKEKGEGDVPQAAAAAAAAAEAAPAATAAATTKSSASPAAGPRAGDGARAPEYTEQQLTGLQQMNNGIHQICLGISPQPDLAPPKGLKDRYRFRWGAAGSVRVTQFTFQLQGNEEKVDIVRGLAQYISFEMQWCPLEQAEPSTLRSCDSLEKVSAGQTGAVLVRCTEFMQHSSSSDVATEIAGIPDKIFLVSSAGAFLGLLNGTELTNFTVGAVVDVQKQNIPESDRVEFDRMMRDQERKFLRSVEEDVRVMWTTAVELWTIHSSDPADPCFKAEQEHAGRGCVNMEKMWEPDEPEIRQRAHQFVATMFETLGVSERDRKRMDVQLLKCKNSQYYECLFEKDTLRPHIADYRKVAESRVHVGPTDAEQMNYHGERWIFHWKDLEDLNSPDYDEVQWEAYVDSGNGVFRRMCEALDLPDPLDGSEDEDDEGDEGEDEEDAAKA